jgi:hypothetical protein
MVKRLDKSRLTQDKQMQKQREDLKAQGFGLQVTGKKIKGETDKDLARVKTLRMKQQAEEKSLKQKQKQSVEKRKESQRQFAKDYINSKNKSKMQMPKLGVAPKEQTIKGGATKFLKRI